MNHTVLVPRPSTTPREYGSCSTASRAPASTDGSPWSWRMSSSTPGGLPRGAATLDVAGIETPNARRDRDLQGRRFFDTANHPTPTFRSVSTRRTGDGLVLVLVLVLDELLTVRGEDCPLSLLTTLTPHDDGTVAVHATGTFDRMTSPLRGVPRWVIGATVDVVVEAVLHPVRAAR